MENRPAHKAEFPPLLVQGFHPFTRARLKALCVEAFPKSVIRPQIMAGLDAVLERIGTVGINGTVWLDGSFTTQKGEPEDVDFILIANAVYRHSGTLDQRECIEWLINRENDPKASFSCDTDVVLEFPEDSPFYELAEQTKAHFREAVYGQSVVTKEPKGIVVLSIPEVEEDDLKSETGKEDGQ